MKSMQDLGPTTLVIFGATGELALERLFPALYHLEKHGVLPGNFAAVGFGRKQFTKPAFQAMVKAGLSKRARAPFSEKIWQRFAKKLHYHRGNFTAAADFKTLARFLHGLEKKVVEQNLCPQRLFYFATLPRHYETIARELSKSGLLIACTNKNGTRERTTRVIVEKPFGTDLDSARQLDRALARYFAEDQIYRIDHYLGKETVQNILATRFANSIFEPIWNHKFIDHVQIAALEDEGIGRRGSFYEQTGALRDFLQNHLLQLLALIAMERPADLSTRSIRDARGKVIRSIKLPKMSELRNSLAVGQYRGYRKEKNVPPRSNTETFAAVKLHINSKRWRGVPFYLRAGKKLKEKITEISLHFKPIARPLFPKEKIRPNVLTFQIQPDEGVFFEIMAKQPGFGIRLHPVKMALGYQMAFGTEIPDAHERLLLDFMQGDQRLFASTAEVEAAWKYVDILMAYLARNRPKLPNYQAGREGPEAAKQLIERDNRKWHI